MARGDPARTPGTGKKRRAKRMRREQPEFMKGRFKPDLDRKIERLKAEDVDGHVKRRKRGDRTDEDCVKEICELVAAGATCKEAREHVGLSGTQWGQWMVDDHCDVIQQYRRAQEQQAIAWADEIVEDAQEATHDDYQHLKLRIDTKKWLMQRNNQRYADRNIVQGGDPDKPVRVIGQGMTPQEAAEAYADTLKTSGAPKSAEPKKNDA